MAERPTLHPATLLRALDAEAEAWARENDIAGKIARKTTDPQSREWLLRWSKQCFAEGAYQGELNVINGKSLADSIALANKEISHDR